MKREKKEEKLQRQYDLIYSYFKSTTDEFDTLEWDGEDLKIIFDNKEIEKYNISDLKKLIKNLK